MRTSSSFPTPTRRGSAEAQHVYSVRFAARELWGPDGYPQDAVYVNLWDDYLEAWTARDSQQLVSLLHGSGWIKPLRPALLMVYRNVLP